MRHDVRHGRPPGTPKRHLSQSVIYVRHTPDVDSRVGRLGLLPDATHLCYGCKAAVLCAPPPFLLEVAQTVRPVDGPAGMQDVRLSVHPPVQPADTCTSTRTVTHKHTHARTHPPTRTRACTCKCTRARTHTHSRTCSGVSPEWSGGRAHESLAARHSTAA